MNRVYTDIHVHAVPRAGYTEHDLWERTAFRFLRQLSLGGSGIANSQDDPATTYITVLRERLGAARHVNRAVLLALDGVYDRQGHFDTRLTRFHVPNDDVVAWCQQ